MIFLLLENHFYQYVDEAGFLHVSLFLPLGILFAVIGVVILLYFAMVIFMKIIFAKLKAAQYK